MPIRCRWTMSTSPAGAPAPRRLATLLLAVLLSAAALPAPAAAQEPPASSLLENLNRDFNAAVYIPLREMRRVESRLVFARFRELWSTDGTAVGTHRLCGPGGEEECVELNRVRPSPAGLVFFTDSEFRVLSRRLWRTDGTEAGTFPVTSPARVELALFVAGTRAHVHGPSGRLFFAAADEVQNTGRELWVSDGTESGTRLVADLHPGDRGSFPSFGATLGTRVIFAADNSAADREPWITDGTADGTFRLADLVPGPRGSRPFGFAPAGEEVLFFTFPEGGPFALQRTDGTTAGTREVVRFTGERALEDVLEVFPAPGGRLLFTALGPDPELWGSDGTADGTRRLARLGGRAGDDVGLLTVGSRVVFFGSSAEEGVEPWITDGTPQGTRTLVDACPGPCSSVVAGSWPAGEAATVFTLDDGGPRGAELWLTDGTPEGTRRVTDLCPGPCDGTPEVIDGGPGFLFLRGDGGDGEELWRLALDDGELRRLTDLELEDPVLARFQGALLEEGVLVAPAVDPVRGQSLWRSDGTVAGTEPYFLLEGPIDQGSNPRGFRPLAGEVFFTVDAPEPGLWTSDGTSAETRRVWPAPDGVALLRGLTVLGDLLVFTAIREGGEVDLYASDGTAVGTRPLAFDVDRREPPGGLPELDPELHAAGGLAYLVSTTGEPGLWVTDGSPEGTRRLAELALARRSGAVAGNRFFFTASARGTSPLDLWVSDGTPEGTRPLTEFEPADGFLPTSPGNFSLDPEELTAVGERLFFTVLEDGRRRLWESDGTPAGTRAVATPRGPVEAHGLRAVGRLLFFFGRLEEEGSLDTGLWVADGPGLRRLATLRGFSGVDLRGTLFFLRTSATGAPRLWRSDGTPGGTRPVPALPTGLRPRRLHTVAGRLLVTTRSTDQPAELWLVDADLEGAERVGTFTSEAVTDFVRVGDRVLHSAFQRETGREPWVFELPACSPQRPELCPESRRLGGAP